MALTHIFFDLHGVLIDSKRMAQNYRKGLRQIMAARYGQAPEIWEKAHSRIVGDWDSYFADLNLSGDDAMRDLKEGWIRVTRALFRLAKVTEPDKDEIALLSLELPATAPAYGDALYEDARSAIKQLHEKSYRLGVVTHALAGQAKSALKGAKVLDYFAAPIVGMDTVGQFDKDRMFFIKTAHLAQVEPEKCLVVDTNEASLAGAKSAGMQVILMKRNASENDTEVVTNLNQLLLLDGIR
jgi:FMN phosphatase YigB (HAD superfamily)